MIGVITGSIGFSYAEMSEQEQNMTENAEQNMTDQTNTVPADLENFGTQVSAFVHEAMSQFQEQRQQTLSQIKQCRENIMNADPSEIAQVRKDCRKNLDEIRNSYKEIRGTFHDTFKEFRDNIKVFQADAKGHKISDSDIQNAIKNIQEDVKAKHLKMQKLGQNATDVENLKKRIMSAHKHR